MISGQVNRRPVLNAQVNTYPLREEGKCTAPLKGAVGPRRVLSFIEEAAVPEPEEVAEGAEARGRGTPRVGAAVRGQEAE